MRSLHTLGMIRHGDRTKLARLFAVSPRTITNWCGRESGTRSPGRPRHGDDVRAWARAEVERVRASLPVGHQGWRSVLDALDCEGLYIPTGLVQESVRELVRESQRRTRQRILENRVHVEVHTRDALWAMDNLELVRDEQGKFTAELVHETHAPVTLGCSLGPPPCGADVVQLLEAIAADRGSWPLVLQTDGGSENVNAEVAACLREHEVVQLVNLPRTPQHNPRAERKNGSLRRASGLLSRRDRARARHQGSLIARAETHRAPRAVVCRRLLHAWRVLDEETPRASLGGLTPAEVDRIAPHADDRACRARFYAEVQAELARVVLVHDKPRARRMAEREVIWNALQQHGLISRTRGGCTVPTVKAERIS